MPSKVTVVALGYYKLAEVGFARIEKLVNAPDLKPKKSKKENQKSIEKGRVELKELSTGWNVSSNYKYLYRMKNLLNIKKIIWQTRINMP